MKRSQKSIILFAIVCTAVTGYFVEARSKPPMQISIPGSLTSMQFSADGNRFLTLHEYTGASSDNSEAIIWDTHTWKPLRSISANMDWAYLTPDGSQLIANGSQAKQGGKNKDKSDLSVEDQKYEGVFWIWDAQSGALLKKETAPFGAMFSATKNLDRAVISGASGLTVWNIQKAQAEHYFPGGVRTQGVLSDDGSYFALIQNPGQKLTVYDTKTWKDTGKIHLSGVNHIAFSSDNRLIAIASETSISLLETQSGLRLWAKSTVPRRLYGLRFSNNDKHLLTDGVYSNQMVHRDARSVESMWDVKTGALIVLHDDSRIAQLAFHRRIAVSDLVADKKNHDSDMEYGNDKDLKAYALDSAFGDFTGWKNAGDRSPRR